MPDCKRRTNEASVDVEVAWEQRAQAQASGGRRGGRVLQTETFGPIAPLVAWETDEELLSLVNGTDFGLAFYVYGDLAWASGPPNASRPPFSASTAVFLRPFRPVRRREDERHRPDGGRFGLEGAPGDAVRQRRLDVTNGVGGLFGWRGQGASVVGLGPLRHTRGSNQVEW